MKLFSPPRIPRLQQSTRRSPRSTAREDGADDKNAAAKTIVASAHYGIAERDLQPGFPTLSPAHDGRFYTNINRTGLVKTWHFWAHTLTTGGRWLAGASVLFFSVGSTSLDLQVFVPLCYATALWICALLGLWWFRPRAQMKWRHSERVGAGQSLAIDFQVKCVGRALTRARVVPHRLPPWMEVAPVEGAWLPDLKPGETSDVRLQIVPNRRGVWRLRGFRLETEAPFGLMFTGRIFPAPQALLVYPSFTSLHQLELPTGRSHHPGGVALASVRGDSFEFWGNREWRDGDNLRDIDWNATARLRRPLGQPVVREYREEWLLRVGVILDTFAPDESACDDFENAVSLSAAVGDYLARQDYLVDIFATGRELHHLTAGRSLAYLDQILDILARVEANQTSEFSALGAQIEAYLGQVTTFICVFLDWTSEHQTFVRHLVEQGAAVRVVIARSQPPTLDPAADANWIGPAPVLSKEDFERGVREI